MGLAVLKERRRAKRYRARGLPGVLLIAESREEVFCFPVDVSEAGIGILSKDLIFPETDLCLMVDHLKIDLEIVWVHLDWEADAADMPDGISEPLYRYGLRTRYDFVNLISLFEAKGCLYD